MKDLYLFLLQVEGQSVESDTGLPAALITKHTTTKLTLLTRLYFVNSEKGKCKQLTIILLYRFKKNNPEGLI